MADSRKTGNSVSAMAAYRDCWLLGFTVSSFRIFASSSFEMPPGSSGFSTAYPWVVSTLVILLITEGGKMAKSQFLKSVN